MNKQSIIEKEIMYLDRLANTYSDRVAVRLSAIRKEKVLLWLTPADKYRLLTLRTWEKKYRIDLEFILRNLLPFWETFIQRRSQKMKRRGLNVRVSTLTGKKSESVLQEMIGKAFPNQENKQLYINSEKECIIQHQLNKISKQSDDGVRSRNDPSAMHDESGRTLTLKDFSTPKKFTNYYQKYMQKEHAVRDTIQDTMVKYPYRGNPFLRECV